MMVPLWHLKKLSTNEILNEPQTLPENWENIFGLTGLSESELNDLAWAGREDLGWFKTGEFLEVFLTTEKEKVDNKVRELLLQCDWTMLPDVNLTHSQKASWIEYRQALRDVSKQPNYPDHVEWPNKP